MKNQLADLFVTGTARFAGPLALPNSCLTNDNWSIGSPLQAVNQQHQHHHRLSQAHGTAATTERRVVHIARAVGSVAGVQISQLVAAVGDSTVTVDVRKNGTTILSGVLTIDNGDAAFTSQSASIASASYIAGDVFEVLITATAGTGTLPQGVAAEVVFRESAG